MGRQQHIVQKLTIEIGLQDSEHAFALQTKITNDYQKLILNSMNEVFDQLIGEDEVVMVDKLEIDLGAILREEMESELPPKIKKEIEDALGNLLHRARSNKNNFTAVELTTSSGDTISVQVIVQESSRSLFETLVYFLEYGIVPWSADKEQKPGARFLVSEAMIHHPDELRRVLQKMRSKKYVFRRLAFQLPEDQLQYLAAILGSDFSSSLEVMIKSLMEWVTVFIKRKASSPGTNLSSGKVSNDLSSTKTNKINRSIRKESSEERKESSEQRKDSLEESLLTALSFTNLSPASLKLKIWEETLYYFASRGTGSENGQGESAKIKYLTTILEQLLLAAGGKLDELIVDEQKKKLQYSAILKKATEELFRANKKSDTESPPSLPFLQKNQDDEILPVAPDAEEGIYIKNAGLVILAPYLPGFFRNLGLVEGKEFINEEAKWKAVHLLQWLVDGDKEIVENEDGEIITEHDLVLNKIICGLDVAEPVPASVELTGTDKEEGMVLLISIIANWSIIKNSSVYTLRKTFLQKEGRLKKEEDNWQLFIQRDSAVDMLIDKLPWGIAMTKLPWNKAIVYVEW